MQKWAQGKTEPSVICRPQGRPLLPQFTKEPSAEHSQGMGKRFLSPSHALRNKAEHL